MDSPTYTSIGFDGFRFRLEAGLPDGNIVTARLPAGTHSDFEHDGAMFALRRDYPILRQWAIDAQTAWADWPNKSPLQKDAAQREVIRRLGIFFDRFGDLLSTWNADA